ncbi:MAG: type VI secretion system tube protein TssD [Bacteroidota bacterium]
MKKIILLSFMFITFITGHAQKVYMKVDGTKSGSIKDLNPVNKAGDKIELTGYSFESSSPRDAATGMASGRRTRTPLTITKNMGQSGILLYNAEINNEVLKTVVIEVYKTNNQGMETLEQTITLTNATVSSYQQIFDETPAPGTVRGPIDIIKFSYQKITFVYSNGGVMAEDSWQNAN